MIGTVAAGSRTSPYQGLRSFNEEDAEFFFGRDEERDIVIANLKASRLTVLYGPSGVGKSSMLGAGVLAALAQQAVVNQARLGSPEFVPVLFKAWRDDPSVGLSAAIAEAVTRFTDEVMVPEASLAQTIAAAARTADATLLVILDQFEDLSLYHGSEDGTGAFPAEFPRLANDRSLPVNFLVSIREDALAELDRFRAAIPWLLDTRLRIGPLSREAARRAITGPLARFNELCVPDAHMEIEGGLVSAVLNQVRTGLVGFDQDARNEAAEGERSTKNNGRRADHVETPYLQLVMARVWEQETSQGSRVLRLSTLTALGGAQEVVRTHLDGVLGGLTPEEQALAAEIFHHLVTPSGTKIALRIPDLAAYSGRPVEEVERLVERLESGEQRILRPVPPPPGEPGPPGVEIFHDVLAPAIIAWGNRRSAERLEREAREAEAETRHERRRARIFAGVAMAAVVLLLLAVAGFVYAEHQRAKADAASNVAESGQLAGQALGDFQTGTLALGSLLSMEAYRVAPTVQARGDLVHALEATKDMAAYFSGQAGPVQGVVFSPDGGTLASASSDGTVVVWSMGTGQRVRTFRGHRGGVASVAFSPDGRQLASVGADGKILVWSMATGQPVLDRTPSGHALSSVAFSPDGRLLASAGAGRQITLLRVSTGRVVRTLQGRASVVNDVGFDRGGELLASAGGDGTVSIWNVRTGRTLRTLRADAGAVHAVAFSPDGRLLASANEDPVIDVWNVATGSRVRTLRGHQGAIEAVAFNHDGSMLASGSGDNTVGVWNVATGTAVRFLFGHTNTVASVAFSPDGRIASGSGDESVIVWNPAPVAPSSELALNAGSSVYSVAFSHGGRQLAAGITGGVELWNAPLGTPGRVLPFDSNLTAVYSVAFSPDGQMVAGAGQDGSVMVWNAVSGAPPRTLHAGTAVYSLAFNRTGSLLAAAGEDGSVFLWNLNASDPARRVQVDSSALYAVAFSPDGTTVAAAGAAASIFLLDARSGRRKHTLRGHTATVEGLAFSPRGNVLASASDDQSVILWNAATGRELGDPLRGHLGQVTSVGFSPNGRMLASGSRDGTAIVWNVATRLGQPVSDEASPVTGVAFSSTGSTLAIGADNHSVDILTSVPATGPSSIFDRLCGIVRTNLTRSQWGEFVPGRPYERTCARYR